MDYLRSMICPVILLTDFGIRNSTASVISLGAQLSSSPAQEPRRWLPISIIHSLISVLGSKLFVSLYARFVQSR